MTEIPVHHNRSIEWMRPAPEGGIEVLCDCATITVLQFEGTFTDGQEIAFTCDGCHTVHWLTARITTNPAGQP